jgi:hypothetical protein
MIRPVTENKYRFNMQVSARAMASAIILLHNRMTARHDRFPGYPANGSRCRGALPTEQMAAQSRCCFEKRITDP